jgi:hypothetical protein
MDESIPDEGCLPIDRLETAELEDARRVPGGVRNKGHGVRSEE